MSEHVGEASKFTASWKEKIGLLPKLLVTNRFAYIVQLEGSGQLKNPVTSSGIELTQTKKHI
jgi:hypothetical protein